MPLCWSDLNYKHEKELQHSRGSTHVPFSLLQLSRPPFPQLILLPSQELRTPAHLTETSGDRFAVGMKALNQQVLTEY